MNIVLLGPPGAGKGTQSLKCQHRYHFSLIASGGLLREEAKRGTKLGKQIAAYLDQGYLVPHEAIIKLVQEQLKLQKDSQGILFDGFPRALPQAISLDRLFYIHGLQLDGVIFINVPEQEIQRRIQERAKSSGRADDQGEAKLVTRMQLYHQETESLMIYYKKQKKMFQVDGMADRETVFKRIAAILDSLQETQQ
ncbi:MAG: adenylate kinase [Bacteroidota bacterium]